MFGRGTPPNACPSVAYPRQVSESAKVWSWGNSCVQDYAADRPSMSAVVFMLGNDSTLPDPKQPAFVFKKTNYESSNPSTSEGIYSVNDVSITMIEAR